jgi:hypothetical protein
MRILVNCTGFIGDTLFASSLAKKLKEKYPDCHITFKTRLVQPKLLLAQNPYIDDVAENVFGNFNLVITPPNISQEYPATIQIQAAAGIEDQSLEFDVYTVPEYDMEAREHLDAIRLPHDNPDAQLVAFQNNWEEKSFLFTKEEYDRAIDVPHLGYGGKRRDINKIYRALADDPNIILVNVGHQCGVTQTDSRAHDADSFAFTASVIKQCDWFIGGEGGLSNLAAAVGTKCIITTDYIWQLYGPNGVIRRLENPQMGPATYYPDAGHVHLDPFLTDEEVIASIQKIIHDRF